MTGPVDQPLLRVQNLRKAFPVKTGEIVALNNVCFEVQQGQTTAIVGESGCGKSTLALSLLGLIQADAGTLIFNGATLSMDARAVQKRFGRDFGIVFQNPHSALDPKMRVHQIVAEPLRALEKLRGRALRDRVMLAMGDVGLGEEHLYRYPHELSGGQRQRIAIARALAARPRLLILDEPTAALDVSVQSQVLTLLRDLQNSHGISYIFITHDLGTVEYFADQIVVMYLGTVVESGPVDQVFATPFHPYTRALLGSVPTIDFARWGQLQTLEGEIPSALNRPPGCPFAPRCASATERCCTAMPTRTTPAPGRDVVCFNPLNMHHITNGEAQ